MSNIIQGDQIYITVYFWYLVKRDLSSVCYCTVAYTIRHFLHGTRKTRPSLSGRVVQGVQQTGGLRINQIFLWIRIRTLLFLAFGSGPRSKIKINVNIYVFSPYISQ